MEIYVFVGSSGIKEKPEKSFSNKGQLGNVESSFKVQNVLYTVIHKCTSVLQSVKLHVI